LPIPFADEFPQSFADVQRCTFSFLDFECFANSLAHIKPLAESSGELEYLPNSFAHVKHFGDSVTHAHPFTYSPGVRDSISKSITD
jgi:hypothetical protein